jgi:hypothetical protein
VLSILIERSSRPGQDLVWLAGKWFVFWGVGMRLFTAGVSQTVRPEFTAGTIFGIDDPAVLPFIQELGFANIALGLMALLSLAAASWRKAAALAGGIFFGMAGIRHALSPKEMTDLRAIAMVSDLFIALVLFAFLFFSWRQLRKS